MKKINETSTHIHYVDYFKGQQVRMCKDKVTGEIFFNAEDAAKIMGFKGEADMIASPEIQAIVKEREVKTGKACFIQSESTNHIN